MLSARILFSLGFVALGLIAAAAPAQANLIANGSFEMGNISTPTITGGSILVTGSATDLPSWNLEGPTPGTQSWAWYFTNASAYGVAEDGSRFINLSPNTPLSQNFAVAAGNTYTVTFWEAQRADGGGNGDSTLAQVTLAAGSSTGQLSDTASNQLAATSVANWREFSFSFTPDTNTSANLRFSLASGGGYAMIDNVSVTSVPEPTSLALFGLGALGMLAVVRRRRHS